MHTKHTSYHTTRTITTLAVSDWQRTQNICLIAPHAPLQRSPSPTGNAHKTYILSHHTHHYTTRRLRLATHTKHTSYHTTRTITTLAVSDWQRTQNIHLITPHAPLQRSLSPTGNAHKTYILSHHTHHYNSRCLRLATHTKHTSYHTTCTITTLAVSDWQRTQNIRLITPHAPLQRSPSPTGNAHKTYILSHHTHHYNARCLRLATHTKHTSYHTTRTITTLAVSDWQRTQNIRLITPHAPLQHSLSPTGNAHKTYVLSHHTHHYNTRCLRLATHTKHTSYHTTRTITTLAVSDWQRTQNIRLITPHAPLQHSLSPTDNAHKTYVLSHHTHHYNARCLRLATHTKHTSYHTTRTITTLAVSDWQRTQTYILSHHTHHYNTRRLRLATHTKHTSYHTTRTITTLAVSDWQRTQNIHLITPHAPLQRSLSPTGNAHKTYILSHHTHHYNSRCLRLATHTKHTSYHTTCTITTLAVSDWQRTQNIRLITPHAPLQRSPSPTGNAHKTYILSHHTHHYNARCLRLATHTKHTSYHTTRTITTLAVSDWQRTQNIRLITPHAPLQHSLSPTGNAHKTYVLSHHTHHYNTRCLRLATHTKHTSYHTTRTITTLAVSDWQRTQNIRLITPHAPLQHSLSPTGNAHKTYVLSHHTHHYNTRCLRLTTHTKHTSYHTTRTITTLAVSDWQRTQNIRLITPHAPLQRSPSPTDNAHKHTSYHTTRTITTLAVSDWQRTQNIRLITPHAPLQHSLSPTGNAHKTYILSHHTHHYNTHCLRLATHTKHTSYHTTRTITTLAVSDWQRTQNIRLITPHAPLQHSPSPTGNAHKTYVLSHHTHHYNTRRLRLATHTKHTSYHTTRTITTLAVSDWQCTQNIRLITPHAPLQHSLSPTGNAHKTYVLSHHTHHYNARCLRLATHTKHISYHTTHTITTLAVSDWQRTQNIRLITPHAPLQRSLSPTGNTHKTYRQLSYCSITWRHTHHHYTCCNPSRVYSIDNHLLKCQNSLMDSLNGPMSSKWAQELCYRQWRFYIPFTCLIYLYIYIHS